jgi:hypothetical protein
VGSQGSAAWGVPAMVIGWRTGAALGTVPGWGQASGCRRSSGQIQACPRPLDNPPIVISSSSGAPRVAHTAPRASYLTPRIEDEAVRPIPQPQQPEDRLRTDRGHICRPQLDVGAVLDRGVSLGRIRTARNQRIIGSRIRSIDGSHLPPRLRSHDPPLDTLLAAHFFT